MELGPSVVDSDLSVVMVDAQLSRDGTPLTLTGPTVAGTTFTYTIQLNSFGNDDIGNYTCTAMVRPQQPSTFLTESSEQSDTARVTSGNYGTHAQIKMSSFLYCQLSSIDHIFEECSGQPLMNNVHAGRCGSLPDYT